ncbi:MAG: heme-binding protein [Bryobacteraceae bacterium]
MKPFVTGLLMTALLGAAELASQKALTLEVAKQMAALGEAEAIKNKWTVVVALVDAGGHLIYLQKMDETQVGSSDLAPMKAKSAVFYKRPTKTFEENLVGGRQAILSLPNAIPVEGGLPVVVEGKVIGGIGVSGATSAQDGQVAQAILNGFAKILSK